MKIKFEKGKWYKNLGFKQDYIGKFNGMLDNEWCCEEYIYKNTHYYDFDKLTNNFTYAVECTLEEIQQYLPDDHVDRIKPKFKVGDYLSDLDTTSHIIRITKIERNEYWGWGFSGNNLYTDKSNWYFTDSGRERLATDKEIEEFLVEVAKIKYPIGTKFISSKNANNICTVTKENYGFYNVIEDKFQLNVDSKGNYFTNCIYYQGEWATILVEEKPFSLKSSWYIQLTEENFDVVSKWHKSIDRITGRMYNIGSYYGVYSSGTADAWSQGNLPDGKQLITFEQFKQYVLKQKETMEKPFEDPREVTFEMITTHPYFTTLDEKELQSIIGLMDFNGWQELPGSNSTEKTKLLMLKFNNNMTKEDFTIEGSVALKKAFIEECGIPTLSATSCNVHYLCPSSKEKKLQSSGVYKNEVHFILPQQWNEALEYVKEYFKEEEFKVGDYVVITDYGTATKTNSFILGTVYKLSKDYNKSNGFFVEKDSNGYGGNGWSNSFHLGIKLRKATSEEIKKAQTLKYKEFPLSGYTAKVTKDVVLVEGKGKVTAREWLELDDKLIEVSYSCNGFLVSYDAISIGCVHHITMTQFADITRYLRNNAS